MFNKVLTEEQEAEHIIRGIKASQELIQSALRKPGGITKENSIILEQNIASLVLPPRFRDVSAETLRGMIVDQYLQDASIAMINNYKIRDINIGIDVKDEDLLSQIEEKWTNKGIKYERMGQKDDKFIIRLTW